MSHYRKIKVKGKTYEWVSGNCGFTLTVKGLGTWYSETLSHVEWRYDDSSGSRLPVITPKTVAMKIKEVLKEKGPRERA